MLRNAALHTAYLFAPMPMAPRVDMTGRHVIVTGASRQSIGYEVARTLAGWGADVVVTCRNDPGALQRSLRGEFRGGGSGSVTACELNLSDPGSVADFARWYAGYAAGRLDVLINNAGILMDVLSLWRRPRHAPDGLEVHWRTNFLGTFHLTSLLLPMLLESGRRGGDARVLNVVSHQHTRGRNARLFGAAGRYNSWDAYGQSKLALVHMSFELHRRYGRRGRVRSVALHPGSVNTKMIAGGLASYPRLRRIRAVLARLSSWVLLTPVQGAQTTLFCASDANIEGGRYYARCAVARPAPAVTDEAAAARLWEESARWAAALASEGCGGV